MVWVNSYKRVSPASPFGGTGLSGYGREMGFEAMHEYTEAKSVWINVDAQSPPGISGSDQPQGTEHTWLYQPKTMTDEQRKSVALEYLKAFDNGGVTSSGGSILDLFANDAQVYFPKWGLATGKDEIGKMFGDIGATLKSIVHDYSHFNWVLTGTDTFACEGTSHGEHQDGPWRAGDPEWAAGRWCDVFEVRDWLIQRCFIYLDPDYAAQDTSRVHLAGDSVT